MSCLRIACFLIAGAVLAGCLDNPSKEEQEAAKNTIVCHLEGERLVIRFDMGEARMLMPGGDRTILYQVPSTTGAAYSNGNLELRGRGSDFLLIDHLTGVTVKVGPCEPYSLTKESK